MPLNLSRNQIIIVSLVLLLVVISIFAFVGIIPGIFKKDQEKVTLNLMGFEDRRVFSPVIKNFNDRFPYIKVKYQQINFNNYEDVLVNQLAAGTGPDVFMFHSTWLPKHFDKITPVGTERFNISEVNRLFPTVVRQDFAPSEVVFSLPLYIDTLALYYNKEIFDTKGIAIPPRTWLEFQDTVLKTRQKDRAGNLFQPGAAIGGSSRNISRATDILNLLFLQTGNPMVDSRFTQANFASRGRQAFNYYLRFSNPNDDFYTWNKYQPFSADLFAEGKLPMMLHYRAQAFDIKQRSPFLSFGVASAPHPATPGPEVSYADYYGLAVSNSSLNPQAAWEFIIHVTTDPKASNIYLSSTGMPPALRSSIKEKLNDPELGIFAKQALTARSWPQIDNRAVEVSFSKMIESVMEGRLRTDQALRQAESEITQLMSRR
jgi:multiple sugar transport system substrate-binding protein